MDGKECSICGEYKLLDKFSRDKYGRLGRCARCRRCRGRLRREARARNPEKYREISRRRYARDGERIRESGRRMHHKNAEVRNANRRAYYWAHRSAELEKRKVYYKNNEAACNARSVAYRARKHGAESDDWVRADVFALYPACLQCLSSVDLHIDHVLPLSLGGSNKFSNLQTLCGRCNCSKHASYREWRPAYLLSETC